MQGRDIKSVLLLIIFAPSIWHVFFVPVDDRWQIGHWYGWIYLGLPLLYIEL